MKSSFKQPSHLEISLSSLVSLRNVHKVFVSGQTHYPVLKGVDLEFGAGEMLAVVGASGSGKSTLMNIVGFLDRCTAGTYQFAGEEVSRLSDDALAKIRNQRVGFVFQSFFLLPRLNVLQNVMLPLFYRDIPRDLAQQKALTMLEKVGMHAFCQHKPNQLSGGQQQRVAIARAMVGDPDIILADEPTGALDSKTGKDILALFLFLHQVEKRSIMIITHDNEVSRLCQRTVSMRDGLIV